MKLENEIPICEMTERHCGNGKEGKGDIKKRIEAVFASPSPR
jgi:hypothetical protein